MLWQRGKAYSQDLRARVLAAADDGEPVGRIATLMRVSVSYVSKGFVASAMDRTNHGVASMWSPTAPAGRFARRDRGPGEDPS
jgi:hypothetical protein